MAEKVKLSKDGNSIDFVQSESIPTSVKKFRQSPEIEGFYRFIFENDLQKETYEILERIINERKLKRKAEKLEAAPAKKAEAIAAKAASNSSKTAPVENPKKAAVQVAVTKAEKTVSVKKEASTKKPIKSAAPAKASAKKATPAKAPAKKAAPAPKKKPTKKK